MESIYHLFHQTAGAWNAPATFLGADSQHTIGAIGEECRTLRGGLDRFNALVAGGAVVGWVVLGSLGAALGAGAAYLYPPRRRLVRLYHEKQGQLRQLFEQTVAQQKGRFPQSQISLWKDFGPYLPADFAYQGSESHKTAWEKEVHAYAPQVARSPADGSWTQTLLDLYEFVATH